jgi:hypothetical protein
MRVWLQGVSSRSVRLGQNLHDGDDIGVSKRSLSTFFFGEQQPIWIMPSVECTFMSQSASDKKPLFSEG